MKRRLMGIGLLALLLLTILISASCASISTGNKIAVIPLSGPITTGGVFSLFGTTITPELVRTQLARAEDDSSVGAVVLQIDSPGGAVAPCQEILEEIGKIRQSKPVVVSMGNEAASGGYYISAEADRIVALPGTLTGSIGVIAQMPNVKGLYEKLGIEMETFKGGKYKDMYSGLRELTAEEKIIMQQLVDDYYEQFIDVVAEGRGLSKDKVRTLATGQLYTGAEAKESGLVDELGGLDTAIDLAAELAGIAAPKVEYYKHEPSLLESLLGMGLSDLANLARMRLLGLDGQDIVLLESLSHAYPQPQYLCGS